MAKTAKRIIPIAEQIENLDATDIGLRMLEHTAGLTRPANALLNTNMVSPETMQRAAHMGAAAKVIIAAQLTKEPTDAE